MTSPNDYRQFAMDCLRWADRTSNPVHKQIMHDLARTWMRTAVMVERSLALVDDDVLASANARLRELLD
jgi:uncharacterized membrane protein